MKWMLPKIPCVTVFTSCNLQVGGSIGTRYPGLCHFQDPGETESLEFSFTNRATTSYRVLSPELLELLTGTSIQLALNKGQEQ